MTYKGYEGKVEFDEAAKIFTGEVINTRDVITFQGESVEDLDKAFHSNAASPLTARFYSTERPNPSRDRKGALPSKGNKSHGRSTSSEV